MYKWKKGLIDNGKAALHNIQHASNNINAETAKLYATIARLKVANDFLAKIVGTYQEKAGN